MKNLTRLIILLTLAYLLGSVSAGTLSYFTYYIYSAPFWLWTVGIWIIIISAMVEIVTPKD